MICGEQVADFSELRAERPRGLGLCRFERAARAVDRRECAPVMISETDLNIVGNVKKYSVRIFMLVPPHLRPHRPASS